MSFANVLGNPTLQALVAVRHSNASSTLDMYVFDKITSAKPIQIFKLSGLIKGDAKISYYNSIMTAQVDANSALNAGKPAAQWTPDLFREFAWNDGSLSQVAFPGIFPDLTRYQAEADQTSVNQGHDSWKNDPVQVAKALEARFFGWQRAVTTTLLSGGGPHDVYATVRVQEAPVENSGSNNRRHAQPPGGQYPQYVGGDWRGRWNAANAEEYRTASTAHQPCDARGYGAAFEAVIGQAVVYDHLYTDIGHAQITSSIGMGLGSYTTLVNYTSSFKGIQEGMVTVYENNGGLSSDNYSAVMIKVLLSPEPGVALGPLPGPSSVSNPSYWTPFVTAPPAIRVANSVSFGNLMGQPTLQAVVVAREILGGGPVYSDIFVFDKITDPHPQLLFQVNHLLQGNAQISGYSTIMTAQVDVNSSINKDKAGLTTDLFREFKWSDGAGTFVPTAFPGIFPDLTRWQAEFDQHAVNAGQDGWKTNAVQVAQRMAAQLLQWPANAQANLVSGGSAQDVDAMVLVKGPNPGGMSINVTLSRLEGNTSNIWVVIGVTSGNGLLTINTPVKGDRLTSPTTITGTGSAFEGVIGQAFVIDHLYATIGQAQVKGGSNGRTTYTVTLPYSSSFQGGTQEGIVVVYMYSQADGSIATAAMQKVMIEA